MFFAPDLATVTHGIQLAVAPVFLLTAVAGMIGTIAGRLARIIDRARLLEDRIDGAAASDPMVHAFAELKQLRLRGVPVDTIEASRIDGASEVQIFFEIMVPQVMSTILVVWTTITITVLKVFDIVMAMTGGQWDTSVLANLMYDWMFRGGGDYGRSSTLAMVLMFAVIPVMAFNIRRFRTEEAQR